jgi:hypothetical protein
MQALRDRHELETATLLSALSDSQATSKFLRAENEELREKIIRLEDELAKAKATIEEQRMAAKLAAYSSLAHNRVPGVIGKEPITRRSQPNSARSSLEQQDGSAPPRISLEGDYFSSSEKSFDPLRLKPARQRASVASSTFPIIPSNMSMIMQEHGDISNSFTRQQDSPPSPTIAAIEVGKRSIGKGSVRTHRRNAGSMSSGSLSFVLTESDRAGSPGSLLLRPEHEVHLEDMDSLDLGE